MPGAEKLVRVQGLLDQRAPMTTGLANVRRHNLNEICRLENPVPADHEEHNPQRAMRIEQTRSLKAWQRYATPSCRVCSKNWDA